MCSSLTVFGGRGRSVRLKRVWVCAALAILLRPAVSYAERIDFLASQGLRSTSSISGNDNGMVSAGEMVRDWIDPPPSGFANIFYSCVDLRNIVRDPQTVSIRSTDDSTGGLAGGMARAGWLFDRWAADIHASGSGVMAAGLQAAIWETLYDSPTNTATDINNSLLGGSFRLNTNGVVRTYAAHYLGSLVDGSGYHSESAIWLNTTHGQDQVTQRASEPSTLLLLGTAMLLMAGRLRRPKSKPNQPTT